MLSQGMIASLPCAGPVGPRAPESTCLRKATIGLMSPIGLPPRVGVAALASCPLHRSDLGLWLHRAFGYAAFGDLNDLGRLQRIAEAEGRDFVLPTADELRNLQHPAFNRRR